MESSTQDTNLSQTHGSKCGEIATRFLLNGRESLTEAVNDYERSLIVKALNISEGKITKAAQILGVSHQALGWVIDHRHPDVRRKPKVLKPRLEVARTIRS